MPTFTPRVVDIYHGDDVGAKGFKPAADAGIWGIIHKASESNTYKDPDYKTRRKLAAEAGLLWGAYHFNSGGPVATQIDNFFTAAQPDEHTLMVLDYEDKPSSQMSIQQAVDFLHMGEEKLGRKLAIYSGNRLKEQIGKLGADDLAYVTSHRLWLCQYGPRAVLPKGFQKYWLWQFTGDGVGPDPHYVPGITVPGGKGIDLNRYEGTRDQLIAEWA
jgi:lysozyme